MPNRPKPLPSPPLRTLTSLHQLRCLARVLARRDSRFAPLLEQPIPFRLERERTPFDALAQAIIYQQLTGRVAQVIHDRVLELFPGRAGFTPRRLRTMPEERLRGAGLSRAKTAALKDLAERTLDGTVPDAQTILTLDDEAILERVTKVRGVGRWTGEMLLIFTLGRLDVFPVDDFAIRKSAGLLYGLEGLPRARDILPLGEIWRPYRTVASLYLWNALNTPLPAKRQP